MRNVRIYLCALFFFALSALRLLFPAEAAQMQAFVWGALDPAGDGRVLLQALGRALDGASLRDGLVAVLSLAEASFS